MEKFSASGPIDRGDCQKHIAPRTNPRRATKNTRLMGEARLKYSMLSILTMRPCCSGCRKLISVFPASTNYSRCLALLHFKAHEDVPPPKDGLEVHVMPIPTAVDLDSAILSSYNAKFRAAGITMKAEPYHVRPHLTEKSMSWKRISAFTDGFALSVAVYGAVGGASAFVEWSSFYLLHRHLHALTAACIAFLIATLINYILSRGAAFKSTRPWQREIGILFALSAIAFVSNLGLFTLLYAMAGVDALLAKFSGPLSAWSLIIPSGNSSSSRTNRAFRRFPIFFVTRMSFESRAA